ncbi:MAG TPA: 2-oxo acid dehydrogenase subunit E2 [Thermoanaerobaculia bacterium]|nr:2-oxo acid dehydrogenase subunit E2 [Thermoanaerobaculia bacterium]
MAVREIKVPDIGGFEAVDVVEVLVDSGERIAKDQSLITLESDKATMDVPSPLAGTVREVRVRRGDKVSEGDVIATAEVAAGSAGEESGEKEKAPEEEESPPAAERPEPPASGRPPAPEPATPAGHPPVAEPPSWDEEQEPLGEPIDEEGFRKAYASPSVRRLARELGVDLSHVDGTGKRGRILADDVRRYVKRRLSGSAPGPMGLEIPEMPVIDFSRFGEVEVRELSRIQRISGPAVHRSWLHVPHVTQFEDADITDLDLFRKEHAAEAEAQGFKLTFLAFLLKAAAGALAAYPTVNSSLDPGGDKLVVKKYIHIGFALDTEAGLLVPVIRDVDRKGIFDLARELAELSAAGRDGKLKPDQLQGASFTISSLGGIGGTAFTPIVNAPEVAILGVSRAAMKPVYREGELVPRLMLPLSFSYDHRVIDGALAARFTVHLAALLADLRRLLL